jgi:signal peptide peptidase-like protein 2B
MLQMLQQVCLLLCVVPQVVTAILPTAELIVGGDGSSPYTLLVSQASFGARLSQNSEESYDLKHTDSLLCDNGTDSSTYENSILLVPRGDCTYQHKAYQAQNMGAKAIIIYNNLASRYNINTTKHQGEKYPTYSYQDIIFPEALNDYDCDRAFADIPTSDLKMTPLPYNSDHNDPLLSGDTDDNLCRLYSSTSLQNCNSKRCLVTSYSPDETHSRACCAWDLHLWLYSDDSNRTVNIPAVFITMEQGQQLIQTIQKSTNNGITGILKARWKPKYNPSSFLVWLLGVLVATVAAYCSAGDYHVGISKLTRAPGRRGRASSQDESAENRPEPLATRNPMQEETVELEPIHALVFLIMSSSSLLILFYFKVSDHQDQIMILSFSVCLLTDPLLACLFQIYSFVKVFYAFGCSNAVIQVIVYPLLSRTFKLWGFQERTIFTSEDFGKVSNWHIQSAILGYSWGMSWLYMALFVHHPETHAFYWMSQDILGACMCIVFLSIVQINSIKVATIMLLVSFLYDIFFVFVTPYLFEGESVMVTVATSGGPPTKDPLWCEKYPYDEGCQGGDPLPMLFAVPRLLDYQGGSSLLGLGDIVCEYLACVVMHFVDRFFVDANIPSIAVPGLLLSFAARFDAAKALVGLASGGNRQQATAIVDCVRSNGLLDSARRGYYFVPLVISYAIGLMMANVAVYVMEMGQPALLYLVPCTLGTMIYLGWKQHELRALWDGPRVLLTADSIVYGTPHPPSSESTIEQVPQRVEDEEETEQQIGESGNADDDEAGPLLPASINNNSSTDD